MVNWSVMAYARVNSICNTLFLLPSFLFIPETPVQKRCQVVSLFQAVSDFSNRIIFCGLKEYSAWILKAQRKKTFLPLLQNKTKDHIAFNGNN